MILAYGGGNFHQVKIGDTQASIEAASDLESAIFL